MVGEGPRPAIPGRSGRSMSTIAVFGTLAVWANALVVHAQQPKLTLHACDLKGDSVKGVQFSIRGFEAAVSAATGDDGVAAIPLHASVKPGASVELSIVRNTSNYHLISPWNHFVVVPPFGSGITVSVSLWREGTDFKVGNLLITTSVAERVIAANLQGSRKPLQAVANDLRIPAQTLEDLIRSSNPVDPYERGVKALYQGL